MVTPFADCLLLGAAFKMVLTARVAKNYLDIAFLGFQPKPTVEAILRPGNR
jgi:hypothetical protein